MVITLHELEKRFGKQKVINSISYQLHSGETYAVLGGNGSGKSTLLRLLNGSLSPSSGRVSFSMNGSELSREQAAFQINLTGPYLELIEELTPLEFLKYYEKFRRFLPEITAESFLEIAELTDSKTKEIRNFSSGMKQRFKIALCLLSEANFLLLDEPASNLDPMAVEWYRMMIENYRLDRGIVIGSNFDNRENDFCEHEILINSYH